MSDNNTDDENFQATTLICYTNINHTARVDLGLTPNEYCVIDSIRVLGSINPSARGWCYASKAYLAKFLGISEKTAYRAISKAEEKKLVEKKTGPNPQGQMRYTRTTQKFNEAVLMKKTTQKAKPKTGSNYSFHRGRCSFSSSPPSPDTLVDDKKTVLTNDISGGSTIQTKCPNHTDKMTIHTDKMSHNKDNNKDIHKDNNNALSRFINKYDKTPTDEHQKHPAFAKCAHYTVEQDSIGARGVDDPLKYLAWAIQHHEQIPEPPKQEDYKPQLRVDSYTGELINPDEPTREEAEAEVKIAK